jgi:hypothetical protein
MAARVALILVLLVAGSSEASESKLCPASSTPGGNHAAGNGNPAQCTNIAC